MAPGPDGAGPWPAWVEETTRRTAADGRWRSLPPPVEAGLVSFASNDYLGLARHPAVVAAGVDALQRWGAGTGAARLVHGTLPPHRELEAALARWKGTEAALLFPTGYAANLGVLAAVGGPGVRILSDAANHASLVDGCRLSRSDVRVYRHADADHVAALLSEPGADRTVVATDSVFSMDGDLAPLDELAELCRRHRALLVLDEAHAVLGPEPSLEGVDHLRVGTLSKFLGSLGGFVAGSRAFVELLVNRARPFVFTTAPTPADTAAGLAALGILVSEEGRRLERRLRERVDQLAPGHPSPIVPVVLGEESRALGAAAELRRAGFVVPAIRPPTVPEGTSRLRVSLSAAHTAEQVEALRAALSAVLAPRAS